RLGVVGDRLAVQDDALDLQAAGRGDQLWKHRRHRLEVSREDAHLLPVPVNLYSKAVVLRLNAHHPELPDHGLRVRKTLGELGAERLAHGDLEGIESALTLSPERPGDEAEVGGAVV